MKTSRRFLAIILLILAGAGTLAGLYLRQQLRIASAPASLPATIEIPSGLRARDVARLLREHGIIQDESSALVYLALTGNRSKLRAGEYRFEKAMTIPEVVSRLVSGAIYLHKFSVPEGLTVAETALKWQEQGFGAADEFAAAAKNAVSLVRDLDDKADSVEGYLYPETYLFPVRTTASQAIEAMTRRFRAVLGKLSEIAPAEQWPVNPRQAVILASLIEAEALHDEERPLIASVYLNRLDKGILLQCDPTVIYALQRQNRYRGRLTLKDLNLDSPYNTYRYPGLPPGAINSPGYGSLLAAIKPAMTPYLFFVRTDGGRHTFSESLAAHNRAVARYRAQQRGSAR